MYASDDVVDDVLDGSHGTNEIMKERGIYDICPRRIDEGTDRMVLAFHAR